MSGPNAPAPAALCLTCRSLLDPGQRCGCGRAARPVALDAPDAAAVIEAAILVAPNVDRSDLAGRLFVSSLATLAPIGVLFLLLGAAGDALIPGVLAYWPWFLGLPYGLVAACWLAFVIYSAAEERRPYYGAVPRGEVASGETIEATLAEGALVATELHQRRDPKLVVLRDARVEEALVLRRPGERITVPIGRVDVRVPDARWRHGSSPLAASWRGLPPPIRGAGSAATARLRRGDRVALCGGTLEPVEGEGAGFREAAERHYHWIPSDGRTKLIVLDP